MKRKVDISRSYPEVCTTTRQEYLELFRRLKAQGVEEVVFCGVDEVAEIAYLSLQEAGLELAAVIDDESGRLDLFGHPIVSMTEKIRVGFTPVHPIVITSLKRRDQLGRELLRLELPPSNIHFVGNGGR